MKLPKVAKDNSDDGASGNQPPHHKISTTRRSTEKIHCC